MRKFYVGQKVTLMWEKTPYDARELLKVGIIAKLPSRSSELFDIVGVHPKEPNKAYQFFADELLDVSIHTLNGDVL